MKEWATSLCWNSIKFLNHVQGRGGAAFSTLFTERLRKADRKTESSSIGFVRNGTSHLRNRRPESERKLGHLVSTGRGREDVANERLTIRED